MYWGAICLFYLLRLLASLRIVATNGHKSNGRKLLSLSNAVVDPRFCPIHRFILHRSIRIYLGQDFKCGTWDKDLSPNDTHRSTCTNTQIHKQAQSFMIS